MTTGPGEVPNFGAAMGIAYTALYAQVSLTGPVEPLTPPLWPKLDDESIEDWGLRVADPQPRPEDWVPDRVVLECIRGSAMGMLMKMTLDPARDDLELLVCPNDAHAMQADECTHLFGMPLTTSELVPYWHAFIYDADTGIFYGDRKK